MAVDAVGEYRACLQRVERAPTREGVVEVAEKADKLGVKLGLKCGALKLLHVHHVNGDRAAALKAALENADCYGYIVGAALDSLPGVIGDQVPKKLGEEGGISAEDARVITELAIKRMIPSLYTAYSLQGKPAEKEPEEGAVAVCGEFAVVAVVCVAIALAPSLLGSVARSVFNS